jgi:hypothetical protein
VLAIAPALAHDALMPGRSNGLLGCALLIYVGPSSHAFNLPSLSLVLLRKADELTKLPRPLPTAAYRLKNHSMNSSAMPGVSSSTASATEG